MEESSCACGEGKRVSESGVRASDLSRYPQGIAAGPAVDVGGHARFGREPRSGCGLLAR